VILPLLLENPAELLIANRTEETAARLALEFARLPGCAVGVKPDGTGFPGLAGRAFDLVINATSAGLSRCRAAAADFRVCPALRRLRDGLWPRNRLHGPGARAGARVADGLGMLVEQAAEAFFVWRGVRPHTAPVLAACAEI
jgi:shikimate dehydrogenase